MTASGREVPKEIAAIRDGLAAAAAACQDDPEARAYNAWVTVNNGSIGGLINLATEGAPEGLSIITLNLGNSPELVLALGDTEGQAAPLGFEVLGAMQAMFGDHQYNMEAIDLVEAEAIAPDVCSADKLAIGYMLKEFLPKPVGGIFVNTPCDSQMVAAEAFRNYLGVEPFLVDIPYHANEKELWYIADQLGEQVKYLERVTGKKLSWERLKLICEENNRMVEQMLEWSQWRKHVPCPQMSKIVSLGFPLFGGLSGTPAGTWVASELAADAKQRVQAGKTACPEGEKIRAIWFHDPIWWNLPFYDWLDQELAMVIPMDLFGYVTPEAFLDTTSPESILYSLARKLSRVMPMARQFKGGADVYIDEVINVVHEFEGDCVIFAGHLACKHAWGLIGLLQEALREADIPLLCFPFDMFDPRVNSTESLKEEFRRFAHDVVLPRKAKNG